MRNNFSFAIILALCVISFKVSAQNNDIIPVSPEAGALAKFVNYPVGNNTGIPDITIPLYSVKAGKIVIPINISYHSGGFKINEQSTSVGLGWSLSTDLQISRSINGGDDLKLNSSNGYYHNNFCKYDESDPNYTYPTIQNYYDLLNNNIDQQPDRFYYKLLSKSGAFYFRKMGNIVEAIPEPYNGIQIKLVNSNSFKIIDTDGTIYWFGNKDNPLDETVFEKMYSIPAGQASVSSWKCTSIITPSNDIIHYTYKSKSSQYSYAFQERVEVFDSPYQCHGGDAYSPGTIVYPDFIATQFVQSEDIKYEQLLYKYFIYNLSTPRYLNYSLGGDAGLYIPWEKKDNYGGYNPYKDRYPFTSNFHDDTMGLTGLAIDKITFNGGEIIFNGTDQLNSIVVKDNSNNSLFTITFNQSNVVYHNFNPRQYEYDKTWYLDSVEKKGTAPTDETEKYSFEYFNKYAFTNHMKGSNAWGQINGSTIDRNESNISTVPYQMLQSTHYRNGRCDGLNVNPNFIFEIGSGDMNGGWLYNNEAQEIYAKNGVLNKITYPTGGYTEFEYGPNKFINGLDYPGNNKQVKIAGGLRIEKIKYYDGVNSTSAFEKIYEYGEDNDGAGIVINLPSISNDYYHSNYFCNPIPPGFKYEQTVQYYNGDWLSYIDREWTWRQDNSERKTTYLSNSIVDLFYPNGAPVYYKKVTEYQKDLGTQTGKTIFNYYDPCYFGYYPNTLIDGTNLNNKQSSWKLGKIESETNYKYMNGNYVWIYQKEYYYTEFKKTDKIWFGQLYQRNIKNFIYDNSETKTHFGALVDNDQLNFHKYYNIYDFEYYYRGIDVGDLLLSRTAEKWNENGSELSKETTYTYNDYALVNKTETNNITSIETEEIRYPFDINSGVYTSMTDLNMLSYPIEKILQRDGMFVSSNLLSYQFVNNQYLPSQKFSLETNVPLPSFTLFNGVNKDANYGNNAEITFSNYDTNGNLTMATGRNGIQTSYVWGYNKAYPVAKIENATLEEVQTALGVGSIPDIGTGGLSEVQNRSLRSGLPNALVTTYTYSPLVGMTSQTDPNGLTTYYEYDGLERLKLVKDNDKKITGLYKYHYAGEVPDPPTDPTTLTISSNSQTFDFNGGSATISVTCNAAWTVTSSASWLTATPASGTGNGSFTITCAANSGTQRTATVTVVAGTHSQTVSVTQSTNPTTLTISSNSQTFDCNGGSASISVSCNAAWTVTSNSYWLTVTPDSGTNNGSFTISCNPISEPQNTAIVTVTSGGLTKTVSVTQTTLDFNLVPINSFHVGGAGSNPWISDPSEVNLWYYFSTNDYFPETVQLESSVAPESVTVDVWYYNSWFWLDVYYDYATKQLTFGITNQPDSPSWAVICITSGGTTKRISVKACDF